MPPPRIVVPDHVEIVSPKKPHATYDSAEIVRRILAAGCDEVEADAMLRKAGFECQPDGIIWVGRDGTRVQLEFGPNLNDGVTVGVLGVQRGLEGLPVDLTRLPPTPTRGAAARVRIPDKIDDYDQLVDDMKAAGFTQLTERFFEHDDKTWVAFVPTFDPGSPFLIVRGNGNARFPPPSAQEPAPAPAPAAAQAAGRRDPVIAAASAVRAPQSAANAQPARDAVSARVRALVTLSPPGTDEDEKLLIDQLSAFAPAMLDALEAAGYSLRVTRHRISNADADLRDRSINAAGGPLLADLAEGVHHSGGNRLPSITVRTYRQDGVLRIDSSTLLHEIGHAFDLVLGAVGRGGNAVAARLGQLAQLGQAPGPVHVDKDMAEAFQQEHPRLAAYYHVQQEWFAEVFALYMLDPLRCQRQFPLGYEAMHKRFAAFQPDQAKLAQLEEAFSRAPVVHLGSGADPRKRIAFFAERNRAARAQGMPSQPALFVLEGDPDRGALPLAKEMARELRRHRGNDVGTYRPDECLVRVPLATFNDAAAFEKLLTDVELSGRAALLYLDDATKLQPNGAGFQVIEQWNDRQRDVPPILLAGDANALSHLAGALPDVMRFPSKLDPLDAAEQAELVERLAQQDNFAFAKGVRAALAKKLRGGGYAQANEAWSALQRAQFERLAREDNTDVAAITTVTAADVEGMQLKARRDPAAELARLIGQQAAKDQIAAIVDQAKVDALRDQHKLASAERPRLNLLFAGPPGTGKTTMAELLSQRLLDVGYLKNPAIKKVTIQDLLSGSPEANVRALFEQMRGGTIFVDEMHQLRDTQEGQRAFRAMIPYLADPAYADTVFIGAGYADEMASLVRDVDKGAERRFATVPFVHNTREELGKIVDKVAGDRGVRLDAKAREAALTYLDYRKRTTKNFGNAGEVVTAFDEARKKQTARIAAMDPKDVTPDILLSFIPEDFSVPTPITKEEFWAEMDAMVGWDHIKAELKKMAKTIERSVRNGGQPTDDIEPYIILEGPPGTGKSTLARMLAKFGVAYGLIASSELVETQGARFQGQYVGQTAREVEKVFESAWGRLLFVDEVSGLARAGGTFKEEAAKTILKQMEDYRGKFLMVIADYKDGIDMYLGLDAGLARRHGTRWELDPWSPEQATDALIEALKKKNIPVDPAARDAAVAVFAELAKLPSYASGGDVRSLVNLIIQAIADSDPDGNMTDQQQAAFLSKAMAIAAQALGQKKRADARATRRKDDDEGPYATAAKAAAKNDEKRAEMPKLSSAEQRLLRAVDKTDAKLKDMLDARGPEYLNKAESDPRSVYIKELASQLGVQPEDAVKQLTKIRVKMRKMVEVEEVVQRFQYHCPFCGGIDSASCAYMREPLEWKIQHSLKKPWLETSTKQVEQIVEVDADGGDT